MHLPPYRRLLAIAASALLMACSGAGAETAADSGSRAPALIPAPVSMRVGSGHYTIAPDTRIHADGEGARAVALQFAELLAAGKGPALSIADGGDAGSGGIEFSIDPDLAGDDAERYRLQSDADGVRIAAGSARGLFHGATTLLQLATSSADDAAPPTVPAVLIEDAPRFGWRGFMLDSARHFWSVEEVKQVIDAMALHKLNVLHWHLTDDQGWRVEIKRYPRLAQIGGCRIPAGDGGIEPSTGGPRPYCGFYTQEQIREVVAHAARRQITVVPEFDVPGHATAAIAAYPELGTTGLPLVPSNEWGVFPNLFNVEEDTLVFLENVIAEMIPLFPGPYFHIGGDEAVKDQWEASARVQQRMRALGAKDEMAMQGLMVARLEKFLAGHGKRLIGWDEILEAPLPAQATVMSWRGTEGGLQAARAGHDVVMSPVSALYLDYLQTASPDEPPGRPATVTLQQVYDFEPVPAELEPGQQHHILGLQANLWTEHTRTFARLQHHMFPRLAAVAETGWSPRAAKDYAGFLDRLPVQLQRYRRWNIGYALTPFQVDAQARDERAGNTVEVRLDNPLGYQVRYTTDGGEPDAGAAVYTGPLRLALPATLRSAAFAHGKALGPARTFHYDAASLLVRRNDQLDRCPDAGDLLLRLEDDGPADGERAIFNTTIFYPCWQWTGADLTGVAAIKVRAGRIPYYFQLAHDEPARRFEPARSAHGELDIHADGCDGQRLASVALPAAPGADGFIEVSAALPSGMAGRRDLCLRMTGDTRPQMWVLDRATLVLH